MPGERERQKRMKLMNLNAHVVKRVFLSWFLLAGVFLRKKKNYIFNYTEVFLVMCVLLQIHCDLMKRFFRSTYINGTK